MEIHFIYDANSLTLIIIFKDFFAKGLLFFSSLAKYSYLAYLFFSFKTSAFYRSEFHNVRMIATYNLQNCD